MRDVMMPDNRRDLQALHRLDDYPVLAALAARVTTATRLDGRACAQIYTQAMADIDPASIGPEERAFIQRLGVSARKH